MSISLSAIVLPSFTQTLNALTGILDKAAAHCEAKKIDPAALLHARLFPDMFHFTRQVQLVTDFSKGAAARLAGVEMPKYEDNETTFEALKARVAKTLAFITSLDAAAIDAGAVRDVTFPIGGGQTMTTNGLTYFVHAVLPNVQFHATTAYNILRTNGVELGKRDYLARA